MDLVPYIFHERQEAGSQLCAQHCLNNLLQQPVYTEFDLAEVASKLDQAESAAMYRNTETHKSYNFDDTGFFSISVLETALQVWDLTLVRWRGEAMKQYQDKPEEQSAFIINLSSHWFTLRRFSNSSTALKRWYNLNSFLQQPEWISPTYLHLVLKQVEEEGYSVFVVRRAAAGPEDANPGEAEGWGDGGIAILPESGADIMAIELGEPLGRGGATATASITAANARIWGEPGPSRQVTTSASHDIPTVDPTPAEATTSVAGSGRRRRRQEDFTSSFVEDNLVDEPSADRDDLFSADVMFPHGDHEQPHDSLAEEIVDDDEDVELGEFGRQGRDEFYAGPTDFSFHSRSYDDEDEALQAALKASMNDVPSGWIMPELEPIDKVIPRSTSTTTPPVTSSSTGPPLSEVTATVPVSSQVADDDDDGPEEMLSPEEIRRRRLARFQ